MTYMLLVVEPPDQRGTVTEEEGRERYAQMVRFAQKLKEQGELLDAQSLKDRNQTAARVTVRERQPRIVDGPFAEAREMIGGFFLLNGTTRERAIQIAAQCPAAHWAMIEVRELGPCFQ
jgi:hypothetical protein